MNERILGRLVYALILGGLFAWVVFTRYDEDVGTEIDSSNKRKYLPYIPILLPGFLFFITSVSLVQDGFSKTFENLFPFCFSTFLHISIYYILLMLIFPLMLKQISARARAMLWFLPNYLYLTQLNIVAVSKPFFIIHLPLLLFQVITYIWLAGFLFVITRTIVQHFVFRRRILKDATLVTDPQVLSVWQSELALTNIKKPKFQLIVSKNISSPLSIGFFSRTTRVVLPDRTYSASELSLIFRHELIHICRQDSDNKFFLTFCCAMCWFNPLMWSAMRKSANDLELSCDETVLLKADDLQRKAYANLILRTVADERGFTSCLSASASALQYRLRNIVSTSKKRTGGLIVGLCFFLLFMTCGYITISYGNAPGSQQLWQEGSSVSYEITGLNTNLFDHNGFVETKAERDLLDYFSGLRLAKLTGNYSFDDYEKWLLVFCDSDERSLGLELKDQILTVMPLGRTDGKTTHYQVLSEIDWDYLGSLLYTQSIQSSALLFPPAMEFHSDNCWFWLSGSVSRYKVNGVDMAKEKWWDDDSEIELVDPVNDHIKLSFSHKLDGPITVEVTDTEGNLLDHITSDSLEIPLLDHSAQYNIHAVFADNSSRIEMKYTFCVLCKN